jgi:hypothetical protein
VEVPAACDRHRDRRVAGDGRGEPRGNFSGKSSSRYCRPPRLSKPWRSTQKGLNVMSFAAPKPQVSNRQHRYLGLRRVV